MLAGFVLWAVRRRSSALVDLEGLRSRPTWAATALKFLSGAALYGAMLLYWREVRGTDALSAGLLLIPQGVGSLLSRSVAARLLDRISARRVAMIGFALVGLATVPFAFAGAGTAIRTLMVALSVRRLGLGLVVIPLMTVAFQGLAHEQVPHASIVTRIAQQIGGSVGVALPAVILATAGSDTAFWWTVSFTGIAVPLSFALPGHPAPDRPDPDPAPAPARPRPQPGPDPDPSPAPTPAPAPGPGASSQPATETANAIGSAAWGTCRFWG